MSYMCIPKPHFVAVTHTHVSQEPRHDSGGRDIAPYAITMENSSARAYTSISQGRIILDEQNAYP